MLYQFIVSQVSSSAAWSMPLEEGLFGYDTKHVIIAICALGVLALWAKLHLRHQGRRRAVDREERRQSIAYDRAGPPGFNG